MTGANETRWIGWYGESANAQPVRAIPKKIWSYWHTATLPLVATACLRSWQTDHADYQQIVVTPATLADYLDVIPETLFAECPQRQSDWVRLALLHQHGGIWLDATTLVFSPLDFVHRIQQGHGLQFVGYFNRDKTQTATFPMVENWFLAAPPGSPFIADWLAEFDKSMAMGGERYITAVSRGHVVADLLQGFDDAVYFSMHVAAQLCLRRANGYALGLMAAETDAFSPAAKLGWDIDRIIALLTVTPQPTLDCHLFKLISMVWLPLEARLRRGDYHPASLVGRLLADSDNHSS